MLPLAEHPLDAPDIRHADGKDRAPTSAPKLQPSNPKMLRIQLERLELRP